MRTNASLRQIACAGVLIAGLGCATSTSTPPAASEAQIDPLAAAEPKAELHIPAPGAPELEPIYFDTDRATLSEASRAALQRYARMLREHPEWGVVTIDGHCDERGSEEYNLALGDRRAHAVASYLADLGVARDRLETRSYGEAFPVAAGSNEAAWSRNRRAKLQSEARDSASR